MSEAPVDLSDPIVKISSHVLAYRNLHVIMSQLEQPGLSSYRTPSILYLTSETSLLNTFPEVRTAFLVQFPGRVDYSPTFCEGMLVWLMGLNIWADNKLFVAGNLGQRAMALRQSPTVKSTVEEVGRVLSEVSLLGSDAAVASGEVSLTKRRTSSLLEQIITGGPLGVEIPIAIEDPYFQVELAKYGEIAGVVARLASKTKESLETSGEQLREIEGEVAAFQKHVSDIATLQARESSSKLDKRIATLTIILVVLTAVLAAATIVLALKK